MGTETDCVEDGIEGRSVVIDVHHGNSYLCYRAQAALKQKIFCCSWLKIIEFKHNVSSVLQQQCWHKCSNRVFYIKRTAPQFLELLLVGNMSVKILRHPVHVSYA